MGLSQLRVLLLDECAIGSEGGLAFSGALMDNYSLQRLSLSGNKVGDDGAVALSEVLRVHPRLQKLELDRNGVGSLGAKALAGALDGSNLKTLQILENEIDDATKDTLQA